MSGRPVADSTVLIYLARIGLLDALDSLYETVLVPEPVYAETVVRGREAVYRDALVIEAPMDDFLVRRQLGSHLESMAGELQDVADLGAGEAAAISVAHDHETRCLTDDHGARTTAEAKGVAVGGTLFVLLLGLDQGVLTLDEYHDAIDALTDEGFRMDAALYRRARSCRQLEE